MKFLKQIKSGKSQWNNECIRLTYNPAARVKKNGGEDILRPRLS